MLACLVGLDDWPHLVGSSMMCCLWLCGSHRFPIVTHCTLPTLAHTFVYTSLLQLHLCAVLCL